MKAFPQPCWVHAYGRSFVCILKCLCRSDFLLKLYIWRSVGCSGCPSVLSIVSVTYLATGVPLALERARCLFSIHDLDEFHSREGFNDNFVLDIYL